MKFSLTYLTVFIFLFSAGNLVAQTTTTTYSVPFASDDQNMWGTGSSFSPNIDFEIFRLNPVVNFDSGNGGITNMGGYDFGAALAVDFWMDVGCNFVLEGLTLGEIDIDYPIEVQITYPDSGSFEKGETITINTDYTVQSGWDLTTSFPTGGNAALELFFGFGIDATLTLCAFGCVDINIIPDLELPVQTIDIFSIETTPTVSITYPCTMFPCGGGIPCIPDMCTQTALPASVPDNGLGISGEFNLPYVETTDSYNAADQCLYASGSNDYMTLSLDIFSFLDNFASKIPPPAGTAISAVLGNLSNEYSLPFGSIEYTIFSTSINIVNSCNQEFSFCPEVMGKFELPDEVDYTVTDPSSGTVQSSGFASSITFKVGQDVNITFPCNYDFFNIEPTFWIATTGDNFSNYTYDEIRFDLAFEALSFAFNLPETEIIPEICVPEICIPYCYPNPSWSDPFNWDCDEACTPAFCTPALVFPELNLSWGPLWEETYTLATLPPIPYFNDSWNIGGFSEITVNKFRIAPNPFFADMVTTDVLCKGDETATATVTVTHGTPPYTYVWDNLTVVNSSSGTQTLASLDAGIHYVTIVDANSCMILAASTATEPAAFLSIESILTDDVSCFGGNDGSASLTVSGGTSGYSYSWSDGTASSALSNASAGNYSVTVTDANGCDTSGTITIAEPYELTATNIVSEVNCYGNPDGSVYLDVEGGTNPYSYLWSNGNTAEDLYSVAAGNYSVSVTDANGCTYSENFIITQPAEELLLFAVSSPVQCYGENTGGINLTVTGGTAPYTFAWTNSSSQVLGTQTEDISGLAAGSYTAVVTDAKFCTQTISITVNGPSDDISATGIVSDVNCYNGNDGSVSVSVNGGTSPYSFSWSDGSALQNLNAVAAGSYSLEISDANGCTKDYSFIVSQPSQPVMISETVTDVNCNGESTGSVTISVEGGTPGYTYAWSNGSVTKDISSLAAGNYTLTVTDANNCVETLSTSVQEPSLPLTAISSVTNVNCYGGTNGSVDASVNGGTAPYSLQWSNGNSVILSDTTEDIFSLTADNYTLIITDGNGCQHEIVSIVSQPAAELQLSLSAAEISCLGGSDGAISSIVNGGTAPYNYQWSNGSTGSVVSNISAGTYSLTVTDNAGCTAVQSIDVLQPTSSVSAYTVSDNVSCNSGSDGNVQLYSSGGTPPYTYSWSNGAAAQNIYGLSAGVYTATVTDQNGCIATTGAVISEPSSALLSTTTVENVSCKNGNDGSISVSVNGGTAPYIIYWADTLHLFNNNMNSQLLSGLIAGAYLVRIEDGNGCITEQIVNITEPDALEVSGTSSPVSCYEGSDGEVAAIVTGGTSPYSYSWSNGSASASQTGLPSGYLYVTVTDVNGCRDSMRFYIATPIEIELTLSSTPVSCVDESDATATADAFGGVGDFTYEWNNGSTVQSITDLGPGTYSVVITDANGCTASDSLTIDENLSPCIEIANSFTPNGDGINDTWIIYNIDLYPEASLKIFNQWGNLLYESTGTYIPWDGTYKGTPLPSSTYYYILDLNNGEGAVAGSITIVR